MRSLNYSSGGDWAGQSGVYSSSGCPSDCNDYVDNNPGAFNNAYWNIAGVRVYTKYVAYFLMRRVIS